jgi:hypothetical protein
MAHDIVEIPTARDALPGGGRSTSVVERKGSLQRTARYVTIFGHLSWRATAAAKWRRG